MTAAWLSPEQYLATMPRFVLGTVVLVPDEHDRLLILHDAPNPAREAHGFKPRWLPAGGHFDANENAEQAAKRELWEETHLRLPLTFAGTVSDPPSRRWPATVDHWFITPPLTPAEADSVLLSNEHDEFVFAHHSDLRDLLGPVKADQTRRMLAAGHEGRAIALLGALG